MIILITENHLSIFINYCCPDRCHRVLRKANMAAKFTCILLIFFLFRNLRWLLRFYKGHTDKRYLDVFTFFLLFFGIQLIVAGAGYFGFIRCRYFFIYCKTTRELHRRYIIPVSETHSCDLDCHIIFCNDLSIMRHRAKSARQLKISWVLSISMALHLIKQVGTSGQINGLPT